MWLLIVAFVLGCLALIALSFDPELDEKRRINRMADACRRGKRPAVRQKSRYIQAGLRTK